jgi:hypothetical protein
MQEHAAYLYMPKLGQLEDPITRWSRVEEKMLVRNYAALHFAIDSTEKVTSATSHLSVSFIGIYLLLIA